ncbi:MAG: hypothetical protein ACYCUM_12695 [Solirubrobacteraceae bacterium]
MRGEPLVTTATATSAAGNTSEISTAVAAASAPATPSTPGGGARTGRAAITGAAASAHGARAAVRGVNTPQPAPGMSTTPLRLRLSTAYAVVRGGAVRLALLCSGGGSSAVCRGRLSLTAIERVLHGRRSRLRTIALGHADFAVRSGHGSTVLVRISGRAARLLRGDQLVRETVSAHGVRRSSRVLPVASAGRP